MDNINPKDSSNMGKCKKSVIFINNIMSNNVTCDEEMFFKQFKMFEKMFHQQNDEWHFQEIENKWISIFKTFTDNNHTFFELLKVVEFSFAFPGSNASVERVFSLMNST